ncbi:MAG: hypothetical protein E7627_08950 [Ruminococcaceae bacterium]|nr:hypothetical protein [Oscillospiraceae bacterium]
MTNEYTVDYNLLKSFAKESKFTGVRLAFFISYCIIAFGFLFIGIFSLIFIPNVDGITIYFSFFFVILAVYSAFIRDAIVLKRQYNFLVKTYGCKFWKRTIMFGDENISLKEVSHVVTCNYSDIIDITEKGNKIWIKLSNKTVIRLFKDAFIDCTWEECKDYILSKQSFE